MQLKRRPGAETLNGPIIEGYSALVRVAGVDIMVTCATEPDVAAVVAFLGSSPRPTTHTLTGQPPWYQNETRGHDLDDMTRRPDDGTRTRRRAALARP